MITINVNYIEKRIRELKKYFENRKDEIVKRIREGYKVKSLDDAVQDVLADVQMDLCERGRCYEAFLIWYSIDEKQDKYVVSFVLNVWYPRAESVPYFVDKVKLLEFYVKK